MIRYRMTTFHISGKTDVVITTQKSELLSFPSKGIVLWQLVVFFDRFKYEEAVFNTKKDLIKGIKVFTEPELIKFVSSGGFNE